MQRTVTRNNDAHKRGRPASRFWENVKKKTAHAITAAALAVSLVSAGCDMPSGAYGYDASVRSDAKTFLAPSTLSEAPMKGSEENGVTIVEFADFQCRFCGFVWGTPGSEAYAEEYGPVIGTRQKL